MLLLTQVKNSRDNLKSIWNRPVQSRSKPHPGKITDEELENENGGSGLRYSFDIRRDNVTQEVGVDAKSGKVLENDPEGKNPD